MRPGELSLPVLRIAEPCDEPWEAMHGDDRVRHCRRCGKNVHNVAALTGEEVNNLLGGGQLPCMRLLAARDGRVITRDTPRGGGMRRLKRLLACAAALLIAQPIWGCRENSASIGAFGHTSREGLEDGRAVLGRFEITETRGRIVPVEAPERVDEEQRDLIVPPPD